MIERDRISLLVRRAQAGDELAFAELVRAHQDRAVVYATAILGDYHLAENAAQEAFVDAYRELPSLRELAAFGRWLRTIVFTHLEFAIFATTYFLAEVPLMLATIARFRASSRARLERS